MYMKVPSHKITRQLNLSTYLHLHYSCNIIPEYSLCTKGNEGFPGGTMVKNPPANAGDMGSIPGPGRSHMPWSN